LNGMLHRVTTPLPAGMNPNGGGKPRAGIFGFFWKVLYILACFWLGIILLCLPSSPFWDSNYLLVLYPKIRPVVSNSFFKGFVLGLGILNILIVIDEVAHFKRKGVSR